MDAIIEPILSYGFFRAGLLTAVIVGVTSSVLSCFLVVRGQALLGDAISHSVLVGVALGYFAAGQLGVLPGALVAGIGAGLAIAAIERHSVVRRDAAMGVVFTALFALGLALISAVRPVGVDLSHILFGNVLGVSTADLITTAVAAALVLVTVAWCYHSLVLWSFDAEVARVAGVRTGALGYVFTAALSATIVASLQAVGIILVIAMLIIPGAAAQLMSRLLPPMIGTAVAVGVVSSVGGLYASWTLDVASGPAIVLVAATIFAVVFVVTPRGLDVPGRMRRARAGADGTDGTDGVTTTAPLDSDHHPLPTGTPDRT